MSISDQDIGWSLLYYIKILASVFAYDNVYMQDDNGFCPPLTTLGWIWVPYTCRSIAEPKCIALETDRPSITQPKPRLAIHIESRLFWARQAPASFKQVSSKRIVLHSILNIIADFAFCCFCISSSRSFYVKASTEGNCKFHIEQGTRARRTPSLE